MKRAITLIWLWILLLTPFLSHADEKSDRVTSINQLRQLSKYIREFVNAHEGRLPKSFDELLGAKLSDRDLLISPLAPDQSVPSYELLTPAEKVSQLENIPDTPLVRSRFKMKDGKRLFLFADCHFELLSDEYAVAIEQMRQLAMHYRAFVRSHNGRLPDSLNEMLGTKMNDKSLLVSPKAVDQSVPSYELLLPAGSVSELPVRKVEEVRNPSRVPVIRPLFETENGVLLVTVDGWVKRWLPKN